MDRISGDAHFCPAKSDSAIIVSEKRMQAIARAYSQRSPAGARLQRAKNRPARLISAYPASAGRRRGSRPGKMRRTR